MFYVNCYISIKFLYTDFVYHKEIFIFHTSFLQAAEEERRKREEMEAKMEEERLASLAEQRRAEQKRLENELQLRDILKQQMTELQKREQEVSALSCLLIWFNRRDLEPCFT